VLEIVIRFKEEREAASAYLVCGFLFLFWGNSTNKEVKQNVFT